jgi:hypothetical protein
MQNSCKHAWYNKPTEKSVGAFFIYAGILLLSHFIGYVNYINFIVQRKLFKSTP